jgi:hypothetical protein
MGAAAKLDPHLFINPPFAACPACGGQEFGVLAVHAHSFVRRCRACWYDQIYELPPVRKAILYLDQFVISGFMRVRQKTAKPDADAFYITLYEKLARLLKLQAIICPYSEAHLLESDVHSNPRALRDSYRAFAEGVHFESFDDIRHAQVMARLERWLNGSLAPITIDRDDALEVQEIDIWTEPFDISVELPPIPGMTDKLRAWRSQSHQGLVDVFSNTWKTEPNQTWEYWRDREAASWGRLIFPIYRRELLRCTGILEGRIEPKPHETEPHHFVVLIHAIADRIEEAGCPPAHKLESALRFLKEATADTPFRQIAGSFYACAAKKAASQVRPPTQGFNNDIDVMSCLLPYCDAMFMDNEMANFWREVQGTPTRRLPLKTEVFSLSRKEEFLSYLDQLERAVPGEQRRFASEMYI